MPLLAGTAAGRCQETVTYQADSASGGSGTPAVWRRAGGDEDMAFAESRLRHDDTTVTRTPDLVRWGPVFAGVIIGWACSRC
jgi:hypothetical protein